MRIWFGCLAILVGVAIYSLSSFTSVKSAHASDANIDKAIEAYIRSNPKVIAETLDKYLAEQRRVQAFESVKDHPTIGPKNAKVVFIEFGDYRCGFCRRVQDTIQTLRDEYGDRVLFAYKPFPILSEESFTSAMAAEAAHVQGKFWEFNDQIWANQSRLGDELYLEVAKNLDLDIERFNRDRENDRLKRRVVAAGELAQKNGGSGTPFFLVNGEAMSGAQPIENFRLAIDEMLKQYEGS